MEKVLRIKLLKDPGSAGGFFMRVGSIVELYDGGFRNIGAENSENYYPVFGPYMMLERLAKKIINEESTREATELFEVSDVTGTIVPTLTHNIMDEAGSKKVCTVSHKSLMTLLRAHTVEKMYGTKSFKLSNQLFKDEVMTHDTMMINF